MKQVAIVSGKGGTGKTSFTSNLAGIIAGDSSWKNLVLVDADVDAANLNLVLTPEHGEEYSYSGGMIAEIDNSLCTRCGICENACHFSAIQHGSDIYEVDRFGCEGCTLCEQVCPAHAIRMKIQQNGKWYHSHTRFGDCFHADLFPGQANSGKLVTEIKQQAERWGQEQDASLLLIDGPPGTGCPVMAAVTGVDLAVIVTEPSASGIHDLQRITQTLRHFHIPALVVVNKSDINRQAARQLLAYCQNEQIPVIGEIAFSTSIVAAMIHAQTVEELLPDTDPVKIFRQIWDKIKYHLQEEKIK